MGVFIMGKVDSGTELFFVYWFLPSAYVSVCAAHQQCLFYIHWGIWWGTIHAPRSFLQDVLGRQADLTRHYEVDMLLARLVNKKVQHEVKMILIGLFEVILRRYIPPLDTISFLFNKCKATATILVESIQK